MIGRKMSVVANAEWKREQWRMAKQRCCKAEALLEGVQSQLAQGDQT